jgi:carbon monoxide dehydrogenase subunit G
MRKLALAALLALAAPALAALQPGEDIEIHVHVRGERVTVDLSFAVDATRQQAWSVLTDFEHMPDFVTNLKESRVLSVSGDTLRVFQRGTARYGPLAFQFASTREMKLDPFDRIESRLISGTMRMMEGTTRLVEEGAQTRILYHADSIPGVWIPPLLGKKFIEHETREQFREMREEIIKRKRSPPSPVPQVAGGRHGAPPFRPIASAGA